MTRRPRNQKSTASMRPGQTAPECLPAHERAEHKRTNASMRPGQTAPECVNAQLISQKSRMGFNEAGADCPGMPART